MDKRQRLGDADAVDARADVMSLAIDLDVSVARRARVIAKDQVLATRVLRLANAA